VYAIRPGLKRQAGSSSIFNGKTRTCPVDFTMVWIDSNTLWTERNEHDKITVIKAVGARPMVGLQTLDLPIEVRILCPQPEDKSTLKNHRVFLCIKE
jgi:hypothetical protein